MTPEVGTELVNPVAGTKTVFLATAESTGGEHVEIEATYPPNSTRPARHLHPTQTEHFAVLAGSLEVRRGNEAFTAGVGDESASSRASRTRCGRAATGRSSGGGPPRRCAPASSSARCGSAP